MGSVSSENAPFLLISKQFSAWHHRREHPGLEASKTVGGTVISDPTTPARSHHGLDKGSSRTEVVPDLCCPALDTVLGTHTHIL